MTTTFASYELPARVLAPPRLKRNCALVKYDVEGRTIVDVRP